MGVAIPCHGKKQGRGEEEPPIPLPPLSLPRPHDLDLDPTLQRRRRTPLGWHRRLCALSKLDPPRPCHQHPPKHILLLLLLLLLFSPWGGGEGGWRGGQEAVCGGQPLGHLVGMEVSPEQHADQPHVFPPQRQGMHGPLVVVLHKRLACQPLQCPQRSHRGLVARVSSQRLGRLDRQPERTTGKNFPHAFFPRSDNRPPLCRRPSRRQSSHLMYDQISDER